MVVIISFPSAKLFNELNCFKAPLKAVWAPVQTREMLYHNFSHAKCNTSHNGHEQLVISPPHRGKKNEGKSQRFHPNEQQSEEKSRAVNHQLEEDKSLSFALSDLFPITHSNTQLCFWCLRINPISMKSWCCWHHAIKSNSFLLLIFADGILCKGCNLLFHAWLSLSFCYICVLSHWGWEGNSDFISTDL